MTTIEPPTLDHLLAKEEIQRIIGAYAAAFDEFRPEDSAALFTEDGWIESVGTYPFRVEGRDQILARNRRRAAANARGKHVVSGTIVQLNGDSANVRSDFIHIRDTPDGPVLSTIGHYEDHFIRTATGWLIRGRRVVPTLLQAPIART